MVSWTSAFVLMLAVSAARAEASSEQEKTGRQAQSEPFVGVVEIPALFGSLEPEARVERPSIELRPSPASTAPAVARIPAGDRTRLEYVEHRYEEVAALVYERRDGWYRVRFRDGERRYAWLAPEDAGTFTSLDNLYGGGLNYMTETWDRRLYRSPGRSSDYHVAASVTRKRDAEIVRLSEIGKDRWALVVLLGEGERCTTKHGLESVVGAGWVPVFDSNGKPNVWFFARGC